MCLRSCKTIAGAARRAHSARRTLSYAGRRGRHRPRWPRSDRVSALDRHRGSGFRYVCMYVQAPTPKPRGDRRQDGAQTKNTTQQQQQLCSARPFCDADTLADAASAAAADRAALHTTASGVPNEHVSRLRQWFCSCARPASTTITPAAERINWYGKPTDCCIGSTERLQHAPARALILMTMDEDNCSCLLDELGRCNGL